MSGHGTALHAGAFREAGVPARAATIGPIRSMLGYTIAEGVNAVSRRITASRSMLRHAPFRCDTTHGAAPERCEQIRDAGS